jgi:hypothetical protein
MMDGAPQGKHFMKRHKLTPEQRAEMQQRRAERQAQFEQIQQACVGKTVGQAIQVKVGDKTIDGTCQIRLNRTKWTIAWLHLQQHQLKPHKQNLIFKRRASAFFLDTTFYVFDYLFHKKLDKTVYTQCT